MPRQSNPIINLQTSLLASGIQQKNPQLYQVINGLLNQLNTLITNQQALIDANSGDLSNLANIDFLTSENETALLPNSRNLLAGSNVSFDDATPGERTINVDGSFSVFVNDALEGDGTSGNPLNVKVDGLTIGINGSNELEALGSPGFSVFVGDALQGDGTVGNPIDVKVDGITIGINGSNELEALGGGGFSVFVDVALQGDGSIGSPISVKVDGTSIGVNGSNELESLVSGGTVSVGDALDGDGSGGDPLNVLVDGSTIGINGSNQLTALGSATPGIQTVSLSITDAQIKSLATTPLQLIAAPGANKAIILDRLVIEFSATGGIYSAARTLAFTYATSGKLIMNSNTINWNSGIARMEVESFGNVSFAVPSDYINRAIMVASSGDVTGGNAANYLRVTASYFVVDTTA